MTLADLSSRVNRISAIFSFFNTHLPEEDYAISVLRTHYANIARVCQELDALQTEAHTRRNEPLTARFLGMAADIELVAGVSLPRTLLVMDTVFTQMAGRVDQKTSQWYWRWPEEKKPYVDGWREMMNYFYAQAGFTLGERLQYYVKVLEMVVAHVRSNNMDFSVFNAYRSVIQALRTSQDKEQPRIAKIRESVMAAQRFPQSYATISIQLPKPTQAVPAPIQQIAAEHAAVPVLTYKLQQPAPSAPPQQQQQIMPPQQPQQQPQPQPQQFQPPLQLEIQTQQQQQTQQTQPSAQPLIQPQPQLQPQPEPPYPPAQSQQPPPPPPPPPPTQRQASYQPVEPAETVVVNVSTPDDTTSPTTNTTTATRVSRWASLSRSRNSASSSDVTDAEDESSATPGGFDSDVESVEGVKNTATIWLGRALKASKSFTKWKAHARDTAFDHVGRSLCFDQPMPGARRHLKKKGYIFLAALDFAAPGATAADLSLAFHLCPRSGRVRVVLKWLVPDRKHFSAHPLKTACAMLPLTHIYAFRRGRCILLCKLKPLSERTSLLGVLGRTREHERWDIEAQLDIWALLSFPNVERLMIFQNAFIALRGPKMYLQSTAPRIRDWDGNEETRLYSGKLLYKSTVFPVHLYCDPNTRAIRITVTRPETETCIPIPIWTAFIHSYLPSRSWARLYAPGFLTSGTVVLRALDPVVFQPSAAWKFDHVEAEPGSCLLEFKNRHHAERFIETIYRLDYASLQ